MSLTVKSGSLITLDPSDSLVLNFDWDVENLSAGVTITTSTFTLTALRPANGVGLTKDNPTILSASPYLSRVTQIRVIAGGDSVLGQLFELSNKVVTNESPAQTKERSIRVLIEQK